jgi:antitoxin ParD1/3/4/toxin ParE1/3/4
MQRLAACPGIGHLRNDLTDEPVRFWCIYSYLIVYRPETKPIEVIRVIHGAQDVAARLRGG